MEARVKFKRDASTGELLDEIMRRRMEGANGMVEVYVKKKEKKQGATGH